MAKIGINSGGVVTRSSGYRRWASQPSQLSRANDISSDRTPILIRIDGKCYAFEEPIPKWFFPFLRRITAISELPQNWDSYGGKPVDPDLADAAINLLLSVMPSDAPAPNVSPSSTGGLMLSWRQSGIEIEVEIESSSFFEFYYLTLASGDVVEQTLRSDMAPFKNALSMLI